MFEHLGALAFGAVLRCCRMSSVRAMAWVSITGHWLLRIMAQASHLVKALCVLFPKCGQAGQASVTEDRTIPPGDYKDGSAVKSMCFASRSISLIPNIYFGWFTTAYNYCSILSDSLFWPPWTHAFVFTYTFIDKHAYN